jgi:hypothetical protein
MRKEMASPSTSASSTAASYRSSPVMTSSESSSTAKSDTALSVGASFTAVTSKVTGISSPDSNSPS